MSGYFLTPTLSYRVGYMPRGPWLVGCATTTGQCGSDTHLSTSHLVTGLAAGGLLSLREWVSDLISMTLESLRPAFIKCERIYKQTFISIIITTTRDETELTLTLSQLLSLRPPGAWNSRPPVQSAPDCTTHPHPALNLHLVFCSN